MTACSTAASSRRVRGTAAEAPVTRAVTRTAALAAQAAVTVTVVLGADICTNGSDEVAEWTTVPPGASTSNSSFTATLNDSPGFRPTAPRGRRLRDLERLLHR